MNDQVTQAETGKILQIAESCLGAQGDFVELGCYRGDTSLLLSRLLKGASSDKRLWIYDSFAGLPEKTAEDASSAGEAFRAGELLVSKTEVMMKFKKAGLPLPICKKAFFEELDAERDLPAEIAFAFLDGDLYGSIKTSLKLVEDKMAEDGVIIVHDYNNPLLPGVAKAVEEWLREVNGISPTRSRALAQAYGRENTINLSNPRYRLSQIHSLAVLCRAPHKP